MALIPDHSLKYGIRTIGYLQTATTYYFYPLVVLFKDASPAGIPWPSRTSGRIQELQLLSNGQPESGNARQSKPYSCYDEVVLHL